MGYNPGDSEAELFERVRELLHRLHWHIYHTYDSYRSYAGFPDIVAWKGERLLFIELKSLKGKLTPEQAGVIGSLGLVKQVQALVIRPGDEQELADILSRGE